jgi:hypothetical protein
MAEKKDKVDSFFDMLDEGAKKLESTLKHAHYPGKEYVLEDAEVIAFETQSESSRVRQMAGELSDLAKRREESATQQGDWEIISALNSAASSAYKAALAMESRKALKP